MPDMYPAGEYDLAGFAVGVDEKKKIINGRSIKPGDVVLGLASNGVHSNG
jgi:phosphoribosylformylglycinamidine cyclo-ligase